MGTYLTYISLLFSFILSSQQVTIKEKEIINKHITYLNHSINHVNAISLGIEKFNNTLNKHVKNPKQYSSIILPAAKPLYPNSSWVTTSTFQKLQEEYKILTKIREELNSVAKYKLERFFINYQSSFLEIKSLLNKLNKFSNDISVNKNGNIQKLYTIIKTYETKVSELINLNDDFGQLSEQLFEEKKLPKALAKTKKIAFLAKKIIQQIRQKQKKQLLLTLSNYKKIASLIITGDDLRVLELFGNFDYYDNLQTQSRANIQRNSENFYKLGTSYINNEEQPCKNSLLRTYHYEYCFLDRLIYSFNDFSATSFANKYNKYIERASTPILNITKEFFQFKTQPLHDKTVATNIVETDIKIKKAVLKKNDLKSLEGSLTNNLVLLLDVSGSMNQNKKLNKLKHSIIYLIDILRPEDKLTIITYSGDVKKVLETTTNYNKTAIKKLINSLKSNGKTNAKSGLIMAYSEASKNFVVGGNNRIIIASDGDFQINEKLKKNIAKKAADGIYLSTFQYVNRIPKANNVLSHLAQIGKGSYHKVYNKKDAIKILVNESKQ